jgi:hypothetical protein
MARALTLLGISLVSATLLVLWQQRSDATLSPDAAEAALQKRVGTAYGFDCEREENDGTIAGLDDVDYVCTADRTSESGYWIATNEDEITGVQPMG